MKIDVGIINYNGGTELLECVRSLLAQSEPVRVLVFDNASADDSIRILKEQNLGCTVIECPKNLGYAGACNGLLEKMNADIQVLCNMDLEFDPAWAKNLLACFERHPEAGSVASLVMEKSGVVNAVGVQFGADLFAKNEASGLNISEADVREKEVFGCYGAVMSFRKAAAGAAGKMDASFFLFFEETEWYFRHNLAGFKTVFCPEAKVYHEYAFYDEDNDLNGIIDLLLVYPDHIDLVDFKTSNIEDEAYVKQLDSYSEYLKKVFNKPIKRYLLSIVGQTFKENM
jgi:GT2 family glycosyltransferase